MSEKTFDKFQCGLIEGERDLTPPNFLSTTDYMTVIETLANESKEKTKRFQKLTPQLESILDKLIEEVKNKIGEPQLKKFRQLLKQHRKAIQDQKEILDIKKLNALNAKTKESMLAIMKEASIDPKEITKIHQRHSRMIEALFKPKDKGPKLEFVEVLDINDVPKSILEAPESGNPRIAKYPPYHYNWSSLTWWYKGDGVADFITYLDRITGKLGSRIEWIGSYPVYDYFAALHESVIGFHKDIPQKGKWDVYLRFNCKEAHLDRCYTGFYSEFPRVDNHMKSYVYFTADVFGLDQPINLANDMPHTKGVLWGPPEIHEYGYDLGCFPYNTWWYGQDKVFHFKTEEKLPAKIASLIRVGFYDKVWSDSNGYDVHLAYKNKWTLEKVVIEIEM